MTDSVALCKEVMRPETHAPLFRSAFHSGQCCKMLSRARQEGDGYSDGYEGIAARQGEAKNPV